MKINRKELIDVLVSIKPGLAKKDIEEQSQHFIFMGESIATYNDRICISHPFKTDFSCSAKAEELYRILQGIDSEEVDLSFDGKVLHIKGAGTKSGLVATIEGGVTDRIRTLGLNSDDKKWLPVSDDFIQGLKLCMFSAAWKGGTTLGECVHINHGTLTATDNYRVSQYTLKTPVDAEFLIPVLSVSEMVHFPVKFFSVTDSWLFFKTEKGVIFSCRYLQGKYPDCSAAFVVDGGTSITLPSGLSKVIEEILIMTDAIAEHERRVDITVSPGKITCYSEKEIGFIEKEIPFQYTGAELSFGISPKFFIQVLEKSTSMTLQQGKALFISGAFKHILALPVT